MDGSFVTVKANPGDVDAVIQLPLDFDQQVQANHEPARELYDLWRDAERPDLFATRDEGDWQAWVEFFTRTREMDGRRKGVVEVSL